MKLKIWKMHGAGNDFIFIDDRSNKFDERDVDFIQKICARGSGIGAEGVLIIRLAETFHGSDFKMIFLNPDGSRVGMCGNAARCAALFAYTMGIGGERQRIETDAGELKAEVICAKKGSEFIKVYMPKPKDYAMKCVDVTDNHFLYEFINSGVEHAVLFTADVDKIDVFGIGRATRYSDAFAPAGTNVDFVEIVSDGVLKMRTYERGVENETGACGTGATASALMYVKNHSGKFPVEIKVLSGDTLVIDGSFVDGEFSDVSLSGPARFVFEGVVDREWYGA